MGSENLARVYVFSAVSSKFPRISGCMAHTTGKAQANTMLTSKDFCVLQGTGCKFDVQTTACKIFCIHIDLLNIALEWLTPNMALSWLTGAEVKSEECL